MDFESSDKHEGTAQRTAPRRRYQRPQLRMLGTVRDLTLTLGGSFTHADPTVPLLNVKHFP